MVEVSVCAVKPATGRRLKSAASCIKIGKRRRNTEMRDQPN